MLINLAIASPIHNSMPFEILIFPRTPFMVYEYAILRAFPWSFLSLHRAE